MEFLGMPSDRVTIPENINAICNKRFPGAEKPRNINNTSSIFAIVLNFNNCAGFAVQS